MVRVSPKGAKTIKRQRRREKWLAIIGLQEVKDGDKKRRREKWLTIIGLQEVKDGDKKKRRDAAHTHKFPLILQKNGTWVRISSTTKHLDVFGRKYYYYLDFGQITVGRAR